MDTFEYWMMLTLYIFLLRFCRVMSWHKVYDQNFIMLVCMCILSSAPVSYQLVLSLNRISFHLHDNV